MDNRPPHPAGGNANPSVDGLPTGSYIGENGIVVIPGEGDNPNEQRQPQPPQPPAQQQQQMPNNLSVDTGMKLGPSPSSSSTPKFGRKGDPRMHKAVSARLADQNISLYDALVQGGFNYSRNDDGTEVDNEGITLAQRKNQLSRRVRLARKSLEGGGNSSHNSNNEPPKRKREEHDDYAYNRGNRPVVAGRGDHDPMSEHPDFPTGDDDHPEDSHAEHHRRGQVAKNHPDYAPLYVLPSNSVRNSLNAGPAPSAGPPGYGNPPPNARRHDLMAQDGSILQAAATAAANAASERAPHNPPMPPLGGMGGPPPPSAAYGYPPYGLGASMPGFVHPGMFPPGGGPPHNPPMRPSAVAISSLSSTAQAHGLTLEQLAVRLSSNPTDITKVLTENESPEDSDDISKKKDLSLRLYQVECRALYSRVMLLAGLPPAQCNEGAPMHDKFAVTAWKAEGRRLKALPAGAENIDDVDDEAILKVPPSAAATAPAKIEAMGAEAPAPATEAKATCDGHDHSHSHDRCIPASDDSKKPPATEPSPRHIHMIGGNCGHKAVIHQPEDGPAHIDFFVNDTTVECFGGIPPLGSTANSMWPSRYTCKEMSTSCSSECSSKEVADVPTVKYHAQPRTIDLSKVDLTNTSEWDFDVSKFLDSDFAAVSKPASDNIVV